MQTDFSSLAAQIEGAAFHKISGHVSALRDSLVEVTGLNRHARLGDRILLTGASGIEVGGEVVTLSGSHIEVLPEARLEGFALRDRAFFQGRSEVRPSEDWIGKVIDPFGRCFDGTVPAPGTKPYPLRGVPPSAITRKPLGARLETGTAVFNTFLPLVRGQRLGLFAGSGVGKSTLLGKLTRSVSADIAVVALIGERGREVREFVDKTLGEAGMKRAIVVAATSDQAPLLKRRAAWLAMSIAEYFRDLGGHVLFLTDSVTRFAEAHREVALTAGEAPSMRGFPPSTGQMIMDLAERAGPGPEGTGDITGIFSVLVAGSDMDEPVADILRGVLDGHVVLSREIAERGRFPAVDVLQSVSRSLPDAAGEEENTLLQQARRAMGVYERSKLMIQSGLYTQGSDAEIDAAIAIHADMERFLSRVETGTSADSFEALAKVLLPIGR
jgi:flagellum-specific ATP synthase